MTVRSLVGRVNALMVVLPELLDVFGRVSCGPGSARLPRTMATATRACSPRMIRNAVRVPSAPGAARVTNRLPKAATPTASESCWVVARAPLPAPADATGTSESTIRISDGITQPWPKPATASPGARAAAVGPGHVAHTVAPRTTSPAACRAAPVATTPRPQRATARAVSRDAVRKLTAIGVRARPAAAGLQPRAPWTTSA